MDEKRDPVLDSVEKFIENAIGAAAVPSIHDLPGCPPWATDRITSIVSLSLDWSDRLRVLLGFPVRVEVNVWVARTPGQSQGGAEAMTVPPAWLSRLLSSFGRGPARTLVSTTDAAASRSCPCLRWHPESPSRHVLIGAGWHDEHCPRAYGAAGDPNRPSTRNDSESAAGGGRA